MSTMEDHKLYQCEGKTKKGTQCKCMLHAPTVELAFCKKHRSLLTENQITSLNEFRNNTKSIKKPRKKEPKQESKSETKNIVNIDSKFEKPEECPVCMDSLEDQKEPLEPCHHWVHRDCQIKSGPTCVICRTEIKVTPKEKQQIDRMLRKRKREEEKENRRVAEQFQELINPIIIPSQINAPRRRIISRLEFYRAPPREMELMQIAHIAAIEMASYENRENDPAYVANYMGIITSGIINRHRPWYNLTRITLDEALRNGALSSII